MTARAYLPDWPNLDQHARNVAYDNKAVVADRDRLADIRKLRSEVFRTALPGWSSRSYGPRPRQTIDICPATAGAPWLVFIHGGYWLRNDPADFAYVTQGLVQSGWSAALIGYTLAPQARLGAIVEEIGLALDCLARARAQAGACGPLVLAGWSAGATLAMLHASHPTVDRVMGISGLYDLGPLRDTSMNAQLCLDDDDCERFSPARHAAAPIPITLAVGCNELPALIASTEAMAEALTASQAVFDFVRIGGADHFTILDALADAEGQLADHARSWFAGR